MRLALGVCLLCALSVGGSAYPHVGLFELPVASTLGGAGRSTVEVGFFAQGSDLLHVVRALGARVDLVATARADGPLSFGLRALALDDLGPLEVVVELGTGGVGFAAGLLLGPLRLDWARVFVKDGRRAAIGTFSLADRLSLAFGAEASGERRSVVAALRLLAREGNWWIVGWVRAGSFGVSVGGML
jgi:hypothetical protein